MDVLQEVKDIVYDVLGYEPDEVKPDSHFVEDLCADSLDAIEIVMDVEDRFDIEIDDDEMDNLQTVKDMIDCINRKR
jgi:acyl carrier protein